MYRLTWFAENLNFVDTLNVQNCVNSTGNCVHLMYGLSGSTENLNSVNTMNEQNWINSMESCVQ